MIRQLYTWELTGLTCLAKAFHAEAQLGGEFSEPNWQENIRALFIQGRLGAFGIFANEQLVGALVGQVAPHTFTNATVATEMMWYILPEHRGTMDALKVVAAFEKWAQSKGADAIIMAHLKSSPEGIRGFYEKRGYNEIETHYLKWPQQQL